MRDPRAVAAADAVEAAMTPGGNWGTVEGLKFTFAVVKEGKRLASFDHVWNPRTGQYRVEGLGPDKKRTVVLFDTATRKGRAWTSEPASSESAAGAAPEGSAPAAAAQDPGGVQADRLVEAQGEGAGKLLEWGYGRFINDSYWLLMPLKMKDPGVNLAFEGEKTPEGGEPCDVLRLTFNGVGLTPGDSYWVFVNKKTHLVDRWEFVLEGQEEKDRGEWLWKDWRTFGPLRLAASHPRADGKISIDFPSVAVGALPANAFDAPR